MRDWVNGVIWHQLCDATLWIQLLCNHATLQPVSLGGATGGRVLTGGSVAPLATPKNRLWIVPVAWLLASCSGLLYALRILRTHGMSATSLYNVYRATVAAKLVYCSPAWSGFRSAVDINRLDAFLKQCKRYEYCPDDFPNISKLFSDADDQLLSSISHNVTHVLKPLLPTQTQHSYNLRDRRHNFVLIEKNSQINHRHFIIRQLY